jgi:hypothetical protein
MTMEERIKHLMDKLIACDDAELLHEMQGLLDIFDDGSYREKIRDAVRWAEIYLDRQEAEAHGGLEAVREFLVDDLNTAAGIAGTLQGYPP